MLAERTKGWWKYTDRKCCGPDDFQQVSCLLAALDYNYKKHRKLLKVFSYQQSYVQKTETLLAFSAGLFSKYVQMCTRVHTEFFPKNWIIIE